MSITILLMVDIIVLDPECQAQIFFWIENYHIQDNCQFTYISTRRYRTSFFCFPPSPVLVIAKVVVVLIRPNRNDFKFYSL